MIWTMQAVVRMGFVSGSFGRTAKWLVYNKFIKQILDSHDVSAGTTVLN